MRALALTARQVRFVNKAFWRNPASAFFTFVFPLMFLVIFTALLGSGTVHLAGRTVKESTYYVAAMAAFAVISACYTNVAMSVTFQRDTGILKRLGGTPLPPGVYFAARVLHALFVAVLLVAITAAFGKVAYQASIPGGITLVRFGVMLLIGAGSFCALAFAITTAIPNADASPAIVNASILPLLFLSGIFIPFGTNAPHLDCLDSAHIPGPPFRPGVAGRFPRDEFRLGRRCDRRSLGSSRAHYRCAALQLGAKGLSAAANVPQGSRLAPPRRGPAPTRRRLAPAPQPSQAAVVDGSATLRIGWSRPGRL